MKKYIFALFVSLLLMACPSPTITIKTVNAPEIQGLTDGYYTTDQSFTVKTGYGGNAEYSLDGGLNWTHYNGAVSLAATSRQLFKIVARQYDNGGAVSGNTPVIAAYLDSAPYSVFTVDNISSGVFLKDKTIFIQRATGAVVEYSLNNGSTWNTLPLDSYFITLSTDGIYNVIVKQKDSSGNLLNQTSPVSITIAKNSYLQMDLIEGSYSTDQTITPTNIYSSSGVEAQIQLKDGTWAYWTNQPISLVKTGIYLGDWSNGVPSLICDSGVAFNTRLRDADGNFSAIKSYTYTSTNPINNIPTSGLVYTLSGDNSGYVVGLGTATDANIVIPPFYGGKPVIGIAQNGFSNNSTVVTVHIPTSVTIIDYQAFYNCSSLTDINLSSNITTLGDYAFQGTDIYGVVDISGATSVGINLFYGNTHITEVKVNNTLTTFPQQMFAQCTSLSKLNIPDTLITIGSSVFQGCSLLDYSTLLVNKNIQSIGSWCFSGITTYSIILPSTVTTIGAYAFNCTDVKYIEINSTNVIFNKSPFYYIGNSDLIVKIKSSSVPVVEIYDGPYNFYVFVGCTPTQILVDPSLVSSYQSTAPWNRFSSYYTGY